MATIEEVTEQVASLHGKIGAINGLLDVIREKINDLQVGNVVSQEQLNALSQALENASSEAGQVVTEAEEAAAPEAPPEPEPTPEEPTPPSE